MVKTEALKDKIQSSGFKMMFIADKLGITRASLSNKIMNYTEFTASEIVALSSLLNLSLEDKNYIFLSQG